MVAFGGGTGLPVLLRGLKDRVGELTAVVTVADDGGSSGRLRQELGVAQELPEHDPRTARRRTPLIFERFLYRIEIR